MISVRSAHRARVLTPATGVPIACLWFLIILGSVSGAFAQPLQLQPGAPTSAASGEVAPVAPPPKPTPVLQTPGFTQQSLDKSLKAAGISDTTRAHLNSTKINSLAELRKQILVAGKAVEQLPAAEKTKLRRIALLTLLSSDAQLNAELAKHDFESHDFESIRNLATLTPETLRQRSGNRLSIEEAKRYHNKAVALQRLVRQQALRLAVVSRDPGRVAALPAALQSIAQDFAGYQPGGSADADACPGTYGNEEDLFSPAVYLIYLLDFVEKTFAPDLDSLEKIDRRFFQGFEALPVSQDLALSDSSVRYANQVLENLIANNRKLWPNDVAVTAEQRQKRRADIYDDEFKKREYASEPGFRADIVPSMVDAYLREMGTTRRDLRLILVVGNEPLKKELAANQGLDLADAALQCAAGDPRDGLRLDDISNLGNETVALRELDQIREKKIDERYGALYRWHWRKASKEVARELAAVAVEERRAEFEKHLRGLRGAAIECVTVKLAEGVSSEQEMAQAGEKAKECVRLGSQPAPEQDVTVSPGSGVRDRSARGRAQGADTCPLVSSCQYEGKPYTLPISPLPELFRHYSNVFPAPAAQGACPADPDTSGAGACAKEQIAAIRATIEQAVRTEAGIAQDVSLTGEAKKRIEQKVNEQLESEPQFERQFERLSNEVFQRDCAGEGRTAFLEKVERRADEAWRASVAKAEAGFLTKIRTNLIAIALHKQQPGGVAPPGTHTPAGTPGGAAPSGTHTPAGTPGGAAGAGRPPGQTPSPVLLTDANIGRLSDLLFVDLKSDESLRTTPLAAAIARIHSFVQAVRLGTLRDAQGKPQFDHTKLDEDVWGYLQSYGTWHAAVMVTAYPEDFLLPEVRRTMTSQFKSATEVELEPDATAERYLSAISGLRSLKIMATVTMGDRTFVFARSLLGPKTFYGVIKSDGSWVNWREVPGAAMNPQTSFGFQATSYASRVYLFRFAPLGSSEAEKDRLKLQYRSLSAQDDSLVEDGEGNQKLEGGEAKESKSTVATDEMWSDAGYEIDGPSNSMLFAVGAPAAASEGAETPQGEMWVINTMGAFHHLNVLYDASGGIAVKDRLDFTDVTLSQSVKAQSVRGIQAAGRWIVWNIDGELHIPRLEHTAPELPEDHESEAQSTGPEGSTAESHPGKKSAGSAAKEADQAGIRFVYYDAETRIQGVGVLDANSAFGGAARADEPSAFFLYYDAHCLVLAPAQPALRGAKVPPDYFPVLRPCLRVDKVTRPSSDSRWARVVIKFIIQDGSLRPNGIAISGRDPVLFAKPIAGTLEDWKQYRIQGAAASASNLSLPPSLPPSNASGAEIRATVNRLSPYDEARIYLDENYLHLPVLIAERLRDSGHNQEAYDWLSRVYDPLGQTENEQQKYPGLSEGVPSASGIGHWLPDPFNPYAQADLNRSTYPMAVRLAHVRNLLDWADRLFTQDTSESVNRARQLYELASTILGPAQWATGDCVIDLGAQGTRSDPVRGTPALNAKLRACLADLNRAPSFESPKKAGRILAAPQSFGFKVAALSSLRASKAQTGATLKSLLDRRAAKQHELERATERIIAELGDDTAEQLDEAAGGLGEITIGHEFAELLQPDLRFCLPRNPLAKLFRFRIDSNLAKIRTNRNFAGMPRQLQPYATPVDPERLVKQAASGGIDFEEYIPSLPPPIYRYTFLLERAKALALSAQQLESATLTALEKAQAAEYQLMQARQDVQLERANVTLQSLRQKEAEDGLNLAGAQLTRAQDQYEHFDELIDNGLSFLERTAQVAAWTAAVALTVTIQPFELFGLGTDWRQSIAAASSAAAMQASFERRKQEWTFQKTLALDDIGIAEVGRILASDRIGIADQERGIAELRLENANDTVEFLRDEFLSAALYSWMRDSLRSLYGDQLSLAISTARAAQRALEFERQAALDFISTDYWDPAREGLVGAERLVKDLEKMDQYRLSTATRKKEIEKTISLASSMPAEFQRFRSTGVLDFETPMRWFDGDFPGHYMRLIRNVSVSVLGLIPPNEGIHATLSNAGISRVMVGAPFEQFSTIYRLPESVALSGFSKATGLFELNPNDPMLFPFEGSGAATTWRLEMPKGANRFDFGSLYDVLLTLRYTAQDDREYRAKVLEGMGRNEEGFVETGAVRYFSLHNDFADQWYHLLNPVLGRPSDEYYDPAGQQPANGKPQKPYNLAIDLKPSDFAPNEDRRTIKKVTLAMQMADGQEFKDEWCVPITVSFGGASALAKLKNTEVAAPAEALSGKGPYGRWILSVGNFSNGGSCDVGGAAAAMTPEVAKNLKERVRDLWLIVEYGAWVHYNR